MGFRLSIIVLAFTLFISLASTGFQCYLHDLRAGDGREQWHFIPALLYQMAECVSIAFFLFVLFHRLVSRHLLRMSAYVASLTPQTATAPLHLTRRENRHAPPDELELLVNAINTMQLQQQEIFYDLDQDREMWKGTFDALEDVVIIMDNQKRIVRLNRVARRFLGEDIDLLDDGYCHEYFCGSVPACQECPVDKTLQDSLPHTVEIEHKRRGRVHHVTAAPILDRNGQLKNIVHLSRDVTDNRKLEGQLRQAQKMEAMGTLAGGIAHDFNNILTPILGYSEIVMQQLETTNPCRAYLGQVVRAARRARDLVKQILSFSRQTEQKFKPMNIAYVIKEALKLLRSSIPASIEIRKNIEADKSTVMADPTQVHQLLMNLCTNAYHAMRETGGVLSVSLSTTDIGQNEGTDIPPGCYVTLEVSDTGCGMDELTRERIFEPYFTTKGTGDGTGLGLSIVHGIVTAMDGHIKVTSELGKGSSFVVYFPQVELESSLPISAGEMLRGGNERILVVDDEADIAELHASVLERIGYQVTFMTDSRLALEAIQKDPHQFDLVLTDMSMPNLTGKELSQRLLAIRPGLPIVICTGFSELIDEEKATELGIGGFLMKPVLMTELATCVRKALSSH